MAVKTERETFIVAGIAITTTLSLAGVAIATTPSLPCLQTEVL